jgi:hypothetical protein
MEALRIILRCFLLRDRHPKMKTLSMRADFNVEESTLGLIVFMEEMCQPMCNWSEVYLQDEVHTLNVILVSNDERIPMRIIQETPTGWSSIRFNTLTT